jgi:hypothetical protein
MNSGMASSIPYIQQQASMRRRRAIDACAKRFPVQRKNERRCLFHQLSEAALSFRS